MLKDDNNRHTAMAIAHMANRGLLSLSKYAAPLVYNHKKGGLRFGGRGLASIHFFSNKIEYIYHQLLLSNHLTNDDYTMYNEQT